MPGRKSQALQQASRAALREEGSWETQRPWAEPGQEDPSGEPRSWVGWESGLGASPDDLAHHLVSVEWEQQ